LKSIKFERAGERVNNRICGVLAQNLISFYPKRFSVKGGGKINGKRERQQSGEWQSGVPTCVEEGGIERKGASS